MLLVPPQPSWLKLAGRLQECVQATRKEVTRDRYQQA